MAPLNFNSLSIHDLDEAPTKLNLHLDAHQAPGYKCIPSSGLHRISGSTLEPRVDTDGLQCFIPSFPGAIHQSRSTSHEITQACNDGHNCQVQQGDIDFDTLGPWNILCITAMFFLFIGFTFFLAYCRHRLLNAEKPCRRGKPVLLSDVDPDMGYGKGQPVSTVKPLCYTYNTITPPGSVIFSADDEEEPKDDQTCELALEMAMLVPPADPIGIADMYLLEQAWRCKCQVCRRDAGRWC